MRNHWFLKFRVPFRCRVACYGEIHFAWQRAYILCLKIYKEAENFPKKEQFGLTSQIKRSALSVPSNIAEGYTRHQTKEYIRFLYIAYASLAEVETQLMLAKDLEFMSSSNCSSIFELQGETQRVILGLIESLKRKQG